MDSSIGCHVNSPGAVTYHPENATSCAEITLEIAQIFLLRPGGVHTAGPFEAERVAAPIATAGFAVPFGHAFPFFAVGRDCAPCINSALERWRNDSVNDRNDNRAFTLRTTRSALLALFCGWFTNHGD